MGQAHRRLCCRAVELKDSGLTRATKGHDMDDRMTQTEEQLTIGDTLSAIAWERLSISDLDNHELAALEVTMAREELLSAMRAAYYCGKIGAMR